MQTLYSAGGIVLSKGKETRYLLLLQKLLDGSMQWICPKGGVEEGETLEETARREIYEECGICDLEMLGVLGVDSFIFSQDDNAYKKYVHWFLFSTEEKKIVLQQSEGFLEGKWVSFSEACRLVTHKSFLPFLEKSRKFL